MALTYGLALLAITIAGLWFCLPTADGKVRRYLRGGLDVFAAIAITAGFGIGAVLALNGFAH